MWNIILGFFNYVDTILIREMQNPLPASLPACPTCRPHFKRTCCIRYLNCDKMDITKEAQHEEQFVRNRKVTSTVDTIRNLLFFLHQLDCDSAKQRKLVLDRANLRPRPNEDEFFAQKDAWDVNERYSHAKVEKEFMKKRELDGTANLSSTILSGLADAHAVFMEEMGDFPLSAKAYFAANLHRMLKERINHRTFPNKEFQSLLEGVKEQIRAVSHQGNSYRTAPATPHSALSWGSDASGKQLHLWFQPGENKSRHYAELLKAFDFHKSKADDSLIAEKFYFSAIEKYIKSSRGLSSDTDNLDLSPEEINGLSDIVFGAELSDIDKEVLSDEFRRVHPPNNEDEKHRTKEGLKAVTAEKLRSQHSRAFRPFNGVESAEELRVILLSLARYKAAFASMRRLSWTIEGEPNYWENHPFLVPGTAEADTLYEFEAKSTLNEINELSGDIEKVLESL